MRSGELLPPRTPNLPVSIIRRVDCGGFVAAEKTNLHFLQENPKSNDSSVSIKPI